MDMNKKITDMKYTIRRHLSKGDNFGHWQVRGYVTDSKQGDVIEYIDPTKQSIEMYDCRLYIQTGLAERIHNGTQKKKKPCAYIICESYEISESISPVSDECISFNPRSNPNWLMNQSEIINGNKYDAIVSSNINLYNL
jgi:hypothetical protein